MKRHSSRDLGGGDKRRRGDGSFDDTQSQNSSSVTFGEDHRRNSGRSSGGFRSSLNSNARDQDGSEFTLLFAVGTSATITLPNGTVLKPPRGSTIVLQSDSKETVTLPGGHILRIDGTGEATLPEGSHVLAENGLLVLPPGGEITLTGGSFQSRSGHIVVTRGALIQLRARQSELDGEILSNVDLRRAWVVVPGGMRLSEQLIVPAGGALSLGPRGTTLSAPLRLPTPTLLPDATKVGGLVRSKGSVLPAGTVLAPGTVLPGLTNLPGGTVVARSTFLPGGTIIPEKACIPAGTSLPLGKMLPGGIRVTKKKEQEDEKEEDGEKNKAENGDQLLEEIKKVKEQVNRMDEAVKKVKKLEAQNVNKVKAKSGGNNKGARVRIKIED